MFNKTIKRDGLQPPLIYALGGGIAENKEGARSHVDNKGASWWVVSDRLVCSLTLPSCRHLALATCDSVPYGVWPPIAGVYHRACPTSTGQLGGSAYGPNCKKPADGGSSYYIVLAPLVLRLVRVYSH